MFVEMSAPRTGGGPTPSYKPFSRGGLPVGAGGAAYTNTAAGAAYTNTVINGAAYTNNAMGTGFQGLPGFPGLPGASVAPAALPGFPGAPVAPAANPGFPGAPAAPAGFPGVPQSLPGFPGFPGAPAMPGLPGAPLPPAASMDLAGGPPSLPGLPLDPAASSGLPGAPPNLQGFQAPPVSPATGFPAASGVPGLPGAPLGNAPAASAGLPGAPILPSAPGAPVAPPPPHPAPIPQDEDGEVLCMKEIPQEITREDLAQYFEQFGQIVDLRLPLDNQDMNHLPSHRGFCIIAFAEPKSMVSVLLHAKKQRHVIKGHSLLADVVTPSTILKLGERPVIQKIAVGKQPEYKGFGTKTFRRVFLSKVTPETDEAILRTYFEKFGDLEDVCRPANGTKGIAFVKFRFFEPAQVVVQMRNHYVLDSQLTGMVIAGESIDKPDEAKPDGAKFAPY